ncbi:hypothetical protein CEF21_09135 [Bacillus sp. FJAT-42376]|uniref:hypothetical protein n=1 Tax=Bacillus sp. FJAT-42376 TaxID=2014076 RepID=UPI000F510A3E|nr:hypothetical protein [Bacillus sp. FJAT-42376]AZB42440.1 hypothetical protein CEF21_09135 [Bacillus sp. FJAT-42376]
MQNALRFIPLTVTAGQVVIFPYYIVWLKEVSAGYSLFAWLFAAFSFSAAWGYSTFSNKKKKRNSNLSFLYLGMGSVYLTAGLMPFPIWLLPYAALVLQIGLGFMQGYFRAWHIEEPSYRIHAVNHYMAVGIIMFGISFVKVFSPAFFLILFGAVLIVSGLAEWVKKRAE